MATVDGLFARIVPDSDGDEIAYETWLANFRRLFQEHPYVTAHIRRSLLEDSPATSGLFDKVFAFADELYSRFVEAGVAPRPADHRATVAVQAGMWLTALLLGDHVTRFLGEGAGEPIETRLGRATIELLRHRTLD